MISRVKLLSAACLSVGLLSLSSCGTMAGTGSQAVDAGADPKAVVAARAEGRWKVLTDGNFDAAYGYLSPASRKILSLDLYKGGIKGGLWRGAKTKSVTCAEDLCKAIVLLKYDLRDIKGLEMDVEESWIKEEGSWWYVQKK